ncbi:MAG: hypothetical protein QM227_10655 [Bacillota bacterium]|nr:hypothetical protein [Bacillota bacterium]
MRNEQLKEITDRLELLTEKEREVLIGELDAMLEKKNEREKLFESVKNIIYEIGDINIRNEHGIGAGIGANLIYDELKDEEVSLCYMYDENIIELHVNDKVLLQIDVNSPILEAFKVIFDDYRMEYEQ